MTIRTAPAESLTEAELEAFDRPARDVFRAALADGDDTTQAGARFMEFYAQHAAEISDVGKEERSR